MQSTTGERFGCSRPQRPTTTSTPRPTFAHVRLPACLLADRPTDRRLLIRTCTQQRRLPTANGYTTMGARVARLVFERRRRLPSAFRDSRRSPIVVCWPIIEQQMTTSIDTQVEPTTRHVGAGRAAPLPSHAVVLV